MVVTAAQAPSRPRADSLFSYATLSQLWDAGWYQKVALHGYPSVLPHGTSGAVVANTWAFLPGYPFLVRVLMASTGLSWDVVSAAVSIAFSLAFVLVFDRLMHLVLLSNTARFALILLCVSPLSPILQVAYAESMNLFLVALALYLLVRRRYLWLIPVLGIMSLTRPGEVAFALTLAVHVALRWRNRRADPWLPGQLTASLVATGLAAGFGLVWPIIAWVATGSPSAYTATELAWRARDIGSPSLVPFTPWIESANFYFAPPWGLLLLALTLAAAIAAFFTRPVRRLGTDLRLWIASYALYVLAVFFPQTSTLRILTPMFPLFGALAQPRSRVYRIAIVVVFIAGQAVWLIGSWWTWWGPDLVTP
ncbi:hypothetical protein G3T36_08070 [Diaminobutyricibacter tongyongensis]|uniref:DUF2029 domain-containing protein n=2 Tax=Leifsonia tongyongensis TaxID=1268043 RepID=A0A6L9XX95_9MICO|nr:hypothetical protein [Diaminobutyricibacter tongyongensis]